MEFDNIPENAQRRLPVLPLRRGFLLPGVISPFAVARPGSTAALDAADDDWIIVAVQSTPTEEVEPDGLLDVAVLAKVLNPVERPDGVRAVAVRGVARVRLQDVEVDAAGVMSAEHRVVEREWPQTAEAEALRRAVVERLQAVAKGLDVQVPASALARASKSPLQLVDLAAAFIESDLDWKLEILGTLDPLARAQAVLQRAVQLSDVLEAQKVIQERVRADIGGQEREHILRRQLKAIQEELGEESDEVAELRARLDALELPKEVRRGVDKELRRLERIQAASPERSVAIDWLELVAELPWSQTSGTDVDLNDVERALDESHLGLEDVKKQVLQNLAVRKLAGSGRADVLLLVGPPGVGKTSIAEAIARATQRELMRVALGGVRDEAELRGHRRTYVGARPGRLIEGLRRAGARDPVLLLDEVDKLGRGWQGDPSAALLEILDPEQNHAFTDHYLEAPFDLSRVLFIATANDLSEVPAPLRDRMEVVQIEGYTEGEKLRIARAHVLPKLARNAGLPPDEIEFSDDALRRAISEWTREAGVRQLQRTLGKVYRAAAVDKAKGGASKRAVTAEDLPHYLGRPRFKEERHEVLDQPGVATGLAWTPMGGDVLYVETSDYPGRGELVLTGQLGDVMKESARAALTYALAHAEEIGLPAEGIERRDVHVHVPAGSTPKDGPSAGVTMFTALTSLLTGRRVKAGLAMTGEVSLRGRVLPVGGIKSKVLAANARGLKTVILPRGNAPDLEDVPQEVLEQVDVVLVDNMSEVLARALDPVSTWNPTFPRPETLV